MKKLLAICVAAVMAFSLCLAACNHESVTAAPESVEITNSETTLAPGTYQLTATVSPANASQTVTWSLIGTAAGVSLEGSELTIATTTRDGITFRVKAAAQTDPTVSDTVTFTVNNPAPPAIEISTEAELRSIVLTGNYILTNDIELTSEWEPLGVPEAEGAEDLAEGLSGTLDGNGYTIKNFKTAEGGYNKGFFYLIEETGVVKNLGIESGRETGDGLNGAAWNGVIAGSNRGLIQNCYTDVQVTMTGVPGGALAGSNHGTIENCYAVGPVTVGEGTHGSGLTTTNSGTITNSFVLDSSVNAAVGYNKVQDANIQKSESWMKTAQNYVDAGWSAEVWCFVDGYYPMLRHEGFTPPAALPVLNITNTEEFLDYNVEEQRTLQITYTLSNVADDSVVINLKAPVPGVSVSATGLVTLTSEVADGATFTVVVTSVESPTTTAEKTFTVSNADLNEVVEISSFDQLSALAASTNPTDMQRKYRLINDIDASVGWFNSPIAPTTGVDENEVAYAAVPFTGEFDGNGYTISGFKGGDGAANNALFGEIGEGGTVKNLTIAIGAQHRYVGSASAVVAAVNRGTIENVKVEGPGEVMGAETNWVAGIAFNNLGTIRNCISLVKLSNEGSYLSVAGIACNNSGTITGCFVDKTVTGISQILYAADETLDANCLETAAMQTASTFSAFSSEIWTVADGAYPVLNKGIISVEWIEITTEEQLRAIGADASSLGKRYILMNDIALTDPEETGNYWTSPIGSSENTPFTGEFDGNGYTISNVKNVTAQRNFGFFGYVSGTVKNLCIDTNGQLVTGGNSGVFVCKLLEGGTIENCMTKGEIRGDSTRYACGFCYQNNGTMENCIVLVVISHTEGSNVRGAFSASTSGTGTFTNCIYDATLAGSSTDPSTSTGAVKFYPSGSNNNYTNNDYTTEYLQTASNYDESWPSDIWSIVNGEYPQLIKGCTRAASAD